MLTGCDQIRTTVGGLIDPPSASEITARVGRLAEGGQAAQAIKTGEDFLAKHADQTGDLHRKLAELYIAQGDTLSAVRHLQQSDGSGATTRAEPAAPPPPPASAAPSRPELADPPAAAASTGEVSAKVGPGGVEASAGGVSVRLPQR